jgi:O-antigen ligase
MKKLIPFIALIPLVILALTPPWSFQLDCTINSLFWLWMVFLSGFLTFAFWYQKVSIWLKLLVVWCFVSCFLSRAPYISFTMFWSVIACAYYYSLCRQIEDFTIVFKAVQSIFLFVCLLVVMQLLGKDTLLNFKSNDISILGTIGNKMISGSFVCVLTPLLIINPLNWIFTSLIALISGSSGSILALSMGGATLLWFKVKRARIALISLLIAIPIVVAIVTGDITTFKGEAGRRQVWLKTMELCIKKPLGYGIGTYKILFPYLCGEKIRDQQPGREWNTAHNDPLQILFETGFVGFILLGGWIIEIIKKIKNPLKLAGLMVLLGTMMTQFPARMCQSVLIIIMFLAWCSHERKANGICHKTATS